MPDSWFIWPPNWPALIICACYRLLNCRATDASDSICQLLVGTSFVLRGMGFLSSTDVTFSAGLN